MTDSRPSAAALRTCMDLHERALLLSAQSVLGEFSRARDVVQETFLAWIRVGPALDDPGLKAWLFKVCRNGALDILRKERRMTSLDELGTADREARSAPPDALLHQEEQRSRLHGMLQVLNEKQREAVRLKFQAELSYREIAEVLGISVSHVGVLLHEALRKLRDRATPRAAKEFFS